MTRKLLQEEYDFTLILSGFSELTQEVEDMQIVRLIKPPDWELELHHHCGTAVRVGKDDLEYVPAQRGAIVGPSADYIRVKGGCPGCGEQWKLADGDWAKIPERMEIQMVSPPLSSPRSS